jgi:hypothetical protein
VTIRKHLGTDFQESIKNCLQETRNTLGNLGLMVAGLGGAYMTPTMLWAHMMKIASGHSSEVILPPKPIVC